VQEREGKSNLEKLQFSNPHGEEVVQWLSQHSLSHLTSTFVRNKLNSLRKVSRMSREDVSRVHQEFCANTAVGDASVDSAQVGGLVLLVTAVQSLEDDPRAKTLKERLRNFRDPTVSGLNLIGAQNQLEVVMAKKKWLGMFVFFFTLQTIFYSIGAVHAMNLLSYTAQTRSVLTYSVQVSNNARAWRDVSCEGSPCIFDSSALVAQQDTVVSTLFPQQELARYIQILPATWEGQNWNGKTFGLREGAAGADLRVGFLEGIGQSKLNYRLVTEGSSRQAWLQHGCNRNSSATDTSQPTGQWASVDAAIGEVQCCLTSPNVHVCTRDGCLSGDNDARKVTWPEAKFKCEARGWRLCRRETLNRYDSAGCWSTADRCGYNAELVWTSNEGGLQPLDTYGRLYNDTAIEGATNITVDLGKVQPVRGVELQGGVPDVPFNGRTCVFALWYIPVLCVLVIVPPVLFTRKSPYLGVWGILGGLFLAAVWSITGVVLAAVDPMVPSVFSDNPSCPGLPGSDRILAERPIFRGHHAQNTQLFVLASMLCSALILLQFLRPQFFILGGLTGVTACMGVNSLLSQKVTLGLFFLTVALVLFIGTTFLRTRSKRAAHRATAADVKQYEAKWAELGGRGGLGPHHTTSPKGESASAGRGQAWGKIHPESTTYLEPSGALAHDHLDAIEKSCSTARKAIAHGLQQTGASRQFTWLNRLLFWIGAGGLGPYSRTRKIRQTTLDIDILFEQAVIVNDKFFEFLQSEIIPLSKALVMCQGPVKRPDRALQKVVRRFHRDPRCLTDIVRCIILLDSIEGVWQVLEEILVKSVVAGAVETKSAAKGGHEDSLTNTAAQAAAPLPVTGEELAASAVPAVSAAISFPDAETPTPEAVAEESEPLLQGSSVKKCFRLCKIKDRCCACRVICFECF